MANSSFVIRSAPLTVARPRILCCVLTPHVLCGHKSTKRGAQMQLILFFTNRVRVTTHDHHRQTQLFDALLVGKVVPKTYKPCNLCYIGHVSCFRKRFVKTSSCHGSWSRHMWVFLHKGQSQHKQAHKLTYQTDQHKHMNTYTNAYNTCNYNQARVLTTNVFMLHEKLATSGVYTIFLNNKYVQKYNVCKFALLSFLNQRFHKQCCKCASNTSSFQHVQSACCWPRYDQI